MLPRSAVASDVPFGSRQTLDTVGRKTTVRVLRVSGRPRLIQRLASLGVVPGVLLTVLKPHGPAIVTLGGARIAIGKAAAQSVEIEVTG